LAAWCTRKGSDDERGGADEACLHRGCSLEGAAGIQECLVNAATKLTERLWEYKVHLRARGRVRLEPARIQHRKVGTPAGADIRIGSAPFMFE
jgi:hypothetical protein